MLDVTNGESKKKKKKAKENGEDSLADVTMDTSQLDESQNGNGESKKKKKKKKNQEADE